MIHDEFHSKWGMSETNLTRIKSSNITASYVLGGQFIIVFVSLFLLRPKIVLYKDKEEKVPKVCILRCIVISVLVVLLTCILPSVSNFKK